MTSKWIMAANVVAVAGMILFLAACGGPSQPAAPGGAASGELASITATDDTGLEPADGDVLIMHLAGEPGTLNPLTSTEVKYVADPIFEGMLEYDNATLTHKPRLAESWDIAEDHLTYTFHLRKDARFSDGTPLTAHDVKFTFDKVKDPLVDAPHLRNYYADIVACDVVDDHTIRFTANKPYFKHLTMIGGGLYIMPRHVYGDGDFNKHPANRKPIGSGPYAFESWETGARITLTRNENYWGPKPKILKRQFVFIDTWDAAQQVMAKGELDYMVNVTPEIYVDKMQTPRFQEVANCFRYSSSSYTYIAWNSRKPQFEDKMVRRALTMLLDRELIRETFYHGLARQVVSDFFIDGPDYNKNLQPWPFDPEQAKQLLDAAGWKDSDGDGLRDKGGVPFRFEVLIRNGSHASETIASLHQEELRRVGVEMTIRPLEWATLIQRIDERNFDVVYMAWMSALIEEDPFQIWHSSQADKGSNLVAFKNEEADRIMEQARLEFDPQKRSILYHRFNEIIHEEQPYTFLYTIQDIEAVHKRFHGVKLYPLGLDPREWWVPNTMQLYHPF